MPSPVNIIRTINKQTKLTRTHTHTYSQTGSSDVDSLTSFSLQPVFHDWCNKGRGMCYPVCGMVHIKEHLLLIGKRGLVYMTAAGFLSRYLSGPLPYVRHHITVNKMC